MIKMAEDLMWAAFESTDDIRKTLKRVIKEELGMSIAEFGKRSEISPSTLYKIMSGERDPNLKTLRMIVKTIRKIKNDEEGFIAVIAARSVLNKMEERRTKVEERLITIKEYPATSIEEAIVAAVRAERDGAVAIVCAPITCPTIEKILHIPVTKIIPKSSLEDAIDLAARKYLYI